MTTNYGKVTFEGKEFTLTSEAVLNGRLLPHNNNYNDVSEGERFDFEMSALAVDSEGTEYVVYWIFTDIKGDNEKELDAFDYDMVNRVESI